MPPSTVLQTLRFIIYNPKFRIPIVSIPKLWENLKVVLKPNSHNLLSAPMRWLLDKNIIVGFS